MEEKRLIQGIKVAKENLLKKQLPTGEWNGEMIWCSMLTSQYVITSYITKLLIPEDEKKDIIKYLLKEEGEDGSFRFHPLSKGYMFTTVLAYVALRILGLSPDHPSLKKTKQWIELHGTPLFLPTWGKVWLAILNLYSWDGVMPITPLLWMLPSQLPFHPSKWYCHTRLIYQAMSVLYGVRFQIPETQLIEELRSELYPMDYNKIDFNLYRYKVTESDLYISLNPILHSLLNQLETLHNHIPKAILKEAIKTITTHIEYEEKESKEQGISPVSSLLNIIAMYAIGVSREKLEKWWRGLNIWKWRDQENGLRIAGALSHSWDTAFALQALLEEEEFLSKEDRDRIRVALRELSRFQLHIELPQREKYFRSSIKGGFCFSNGEHHWPVSDCAAEAAIALLFGKERSFFDFSRADHEEAIQFILSRQNRDGGFSSYEETRGTKYLTKLNPTEMFGDCMIDRSYTECTASCIRSLRAYLNFYNGPGKLQGLQKSIQRGIKFILSQQNQDGSWYGSWGICYIYGTFHAMAALAQSGLQWDHPAIRKGAKFLISKQNKDGSWGESWESCLKYKYIEQDIGNPVQTSWALIALIKTKTAPREVVERGIEYLLFPLEKDGNWDRTSSPTGVFMNTAIVDYTLYKYYFPYWALVLGYKYLFKEKWKGDYLNRL